MRFNICDKPLMENQNIKHDNKTSAELNSTLLNIVHSDTQHCLKYQKNKKINVHNTKTFNKYNNIRNMVKQFEVYPV